MLYKGTVVENSLKDTSILEQLTVEKRWESDDWALDSVLVREDQILALAASLDDGPWYIHLWQEGQDDVVVIFKDKTFIIKRSNISTWADAVAYGKSIGIPEEQLDFVIE
jgi:hypothetical protein